MTPADTHSFNQFWRSADIVLEVVVILQQWNIEFLQLFIITGVLPWQQSQLHVLPTVSGLSFWGLTYSGRCSASRVL